MIVYFLEHFYDNKEGEEIVRSIGVFSSIEKAEKAKEKYKEKKGFNNFINSFNIDKYETDIDACWIDGFISGDEALAYFDEQD